VAPGVVHRMQAVYTDQVDVAGLPVEDPYYLEWPQSDAEAAGTLPEDVGPKWSYTPQEDAVGLLVAFQERGRPTLVKLLEAAGLGRPGSERAERLLSLSRERRDCLQGMGLTLCNPRTGREIAIYASAENN